MVILFHQSSLALVPLPKPDPLSMVPIILMSAVGSIGLGMVSERGGGGVVVKINAEGNLEARALIGLPRYANRRMRSLFS